MLERKIYSSWAFSENEREKGKTNYQIYNEDLKPKAKEFWGNNKPTNDELKEFTCYECVGTGYGNKKYKISSNPHNFSTLQLALICDKGNLCFGYRTEGNLIVIHTD
jgi:hypothetical protein